MLALPWCSLTGIVLILQLLAPASTRADDVLLTLTQAESLAQTHAPWLAHHRTNANDSFRTRNLCSARSMCRPIPGVSTRKT
jgi:hypothetical protein